MWDTPSIFEYRMVTMNLPELGTATFNGIESFWSFTKRRLAKFNGVSVNFELHLKESKSAGKNNLMNLLVNYGRSSGIYY